MATVDVFTTDGKKSRAKVELDPSVFDAEIRPHLLHAEVRRQLAKRQRGTHATRNRSAASGGGAKPYRQKGTGRARQGTVRAPQFAGGGVVFGPVPRSHEHSLNKKTRRAALRCALSLRRREDAVRVIEALELDRFSTKHMLEILRSIGLGESGVLVVLEGPNEKVERSTRNIPWARVLRAEGLNVHDVLRCDQLLLTQGALSAVEARLGARAASGGEVAT
jgi:large subunit ribosomal protein L4